MIKFSKVLRELRVEENVSQAQLAKSLNLTQNTISRYETGNREPSLEILVEIAEFFGVSTDYPLGLED